MTELFIAVAFVAAAVGGNPIRRMEKLGLAAAIYPDGRAGREVRSENRGASGG
jgi:hypothetical protein